MHARLDLEVLGSIYIYIYTKIIDWYPSIGESSGGLVGVKVSSIRKVIRAGKGAKKVVGSRIDGGVSDDEQGGC